VRRALADLHVAARFEIVAIDPLVIVDGSHNPQAAAVLAGAIEQELAGSTPTILLGVLADKDARGIVEALAPVARAWAVCEPDSPRALPVSELAAIVEDVTGEAPRVLGSPESAICELLEAAHGPIVATGSLVTAAQVRRAVRDR
jgi:dihydrofolate synthase/folylpolyglutamate synthase